MHYRRQIPPLCNHAENQPHGLDRDGPAVRRPSSGVENNSSNMSPNEVSKTLDEVLSPGAAACSCA
jgi:hypothetical protein